jgi:hypothetical protein
MSRTVGRRLLNSILNLGLLANDILRDNLAAVPGIKPRQTLRSKTFFPARDEILAAAFLLHDGAIRLPGRQTRITLARRTSPAFIVCEAAIFLSSRRSCGANFNLVVDTHLTYQISALEINEYQKVWASNWQPTSGRY